MIDNDIQNEMLQKVSDSLDIIREFIFNNDTNFIVVRDREKLDKTVLYLTIVKNLLGPTP
jgi:hypothetical protein